jgi:hypothetical protein
MLQVNSEGDICVLDEFSIVPGLCMTMLAEKACATAKRFLARRADSDTVTRSTVPVYTPVITDAALSNVDG